MTKLSPSVLDRDDPTYLRMWFGESNATVDRLGVDQRLGATPYALVAEVSRGTPALELKLTQALTEITLLKEQLANLTNLPAGAIDPVLLAQLGYKTFLDEP